MNPQPDDPGNVENEEEPELESGGAENEEPTQGSGSLSKSDVQDAVQDALDSEDGVNENLEAIKTDIQAIENDMSGIVSEIQGIRSVVGNLNIGENNITTAPEDFYTTVSTAEAFQSFSSALIIGLIVFLIFSKRFK